MLGDLFSKTLHYAQRLTERLGGLTGIAFLVAIAIGFGASIAPFDAVHPALTLSAIVLVVCAITSWLPAIRRRSRIFVYACVIELYAASILTSAGDGDFHPGFLILLMIPVLWSALAETRRVTLVAILGMEVSLAFDVFANQPALRDSLDFMVVWPITACVIGYTIHSLRARLAESIGRLQGSIRESAILSIVADELYSTLDSHSVLSVGLQSATRLINEPDDHGSRAAFFLIEGEKATLITAYTAAEQLDDQRDPRIEQAFFPLAATPRLQAALASGGDQLIRVDRSMALAPEIVELLDDFDVERALVHPIRVGSDAKGVLIIGNNRTSGYTATEEEWLRRLAAILELALARALLHEELSAVDHLTHLANRREFDKRIQSMSRNVAHTLIAIDVDRLKAMNDTFGHGAGDRLLQAVAKVLHDSVRQGDVAARTGGDEFALILQDEDGTRAAVVAARIFVALAGVTVESLQPKVSMGIAGIPNGSDPNAAIMAADRALYEAKVSGGNRYVVASPTQHKAVHDHRTQVHTATIVPATV